MFIRVLFLWILFFQLNNIFAQTITSTTSGGNWEDANTWIGGAVPNQNNDIIINGVVSVTSSSSTCRNLTINTGKILQNGGGLGWVTLHVRGTLTNNGTIRNNPGGYSFLIEIWGNINNNGEWNNEQTFLPNQTDQYISQSSGKYFDSEIKCADQGGYAYGSGKLIASSDLTFRKKFNLQGYISGVGYSNDTLYMENKNLTLSGEANIYNGTVTNVANLTILENAYLADITYDGNTTINGRGSINNSNVTFKGNVTIEDTLQNSGGLGWVTLHIRGNLTNNGIIRDNPLGYSFYVEIWGNIYNYGEWFNLMTFFPGQTDQYIFQSPGKYFDTEIKCADQDGYAYGSGKLIAASDLTFRKKFNLQGYISGVGYSNDTLYMGNKNLTLSGEASIYNGTVTNVSDLTILENAYLTDITFDGNTTIKGRGRIDNSNVTFKGVTTVIDTLQNGGYLGWVTPVFIGDLINYGTIKNNDAAYLLFLDVRGNVYNYGLWNNTQINLKTNGSDKKISGTFNTLFYFYKTGEPQAGNFYVDGRFTSQNEIHFNDGIQVVNNNGSVIQNEGLIAGNGSVINNGTFISTHNLQYYDPLNSGLNASINLVDRKDLEKVKVTYYNNSFHPLMTSSVKQWWRIEGNGEAGSYKLTLKYDDDLLNGNDENTLEAYLSTDEGQTWKKISNPLNITRDAAANTVIIGNDAYPILKDFGDIVLSSGGVAGIPSISSAISGRRQIRVGPPNRYTISYWNNNDVPTDKFCFVLQTNSGVHIKSIFSKEISTGNLVEIPIDSLTYDGNKDEAILIIQPLEPKEVRSFDIILTAEPDVQLAKPDELITLTAAALWIGGAILEEFVSNTIVEGCYEMWRPVEHDQSLRDASLNCIKNSINKAVTFENGTKGIAKKAATEIIEKTGKAVVWPVALAKDIYDCLGNTIKGMKDYVNGNFDKQEKELTKVTSWDPNAKEGPSGFGEQGYMATSAPMLYTIFFENKKEATAPAYQILIYDTLDQNVFDVNTVEFKEMSHSMGIASRQGNILRWEFTGIELPPNANPPEGEGWVKFIVHPKDNLPTGTQITNRAVIKFDLNPWLETNTFVNTLDYEPPVSTPTSLVALSGIQGVAFFWTTNDGSGSGIKNSSIFMATNDGPFTLSAVSDSGSVTVPVTWEPETRYRFYVLSQDNVGNTEISPANIMEIVTDVYDENILPEKFDLSQNYPNPFNPATSINYSLPVNSFVVLKVFNILGQEITTLVNEEKPSGRHNVKFDASTLSSGIYLYRITAGKFSQIRKMILIK